MIHDRDTNKLYLAGCLPQRQPDFFRRFERVLTSKNIGITFLPDTKDIWAKDYMPIQINRNKFVRFAYNPDYLNTVKFRKTISDSGAICKQIEIHTESSDIILDGGNVVTDGHAVIMCDKVFKENSHIPHNVLIGRLEQLFETDTIIFIPVQKVDIIGHADGIVRFLDSKTVLVNDYTHEPSFKIEFLKPLIAAGLDCIPVPYNPYLNKGNIDAT